MKLSLRRAAGLPIRKTFAVGFNKTGTRSFHTVCRSLGYRSYHGLKWHSLNETRVFETHDCFSDGFPEDWTTLAHRYPDSRFVLNVRQCRSWILSRLNHIARTKKDGTYVGGTSWGLWDETEEAVVSWIEKWHSHHLDVLEFFNGHPIPLLLVNFIEGDLAAAKVAALLGFDGYGASPHKGVGYADTGRLGEYNDLITSACRRLNLPEGDLLNDLLIPSFLPEDKRGRYPMRLGAAPAAERIGGSASR